MESLIQPAYGDPPVKQARKRTGKVQAGIDLDSTWAKLVCIAKSEGETPVLVRASVLPVAGRQAPGAALRRLLRQVPKRVRGTHCGLGPVRAFVHQAEFPHMSEQELRTAVQIEAEQLIPDIAGYVIDFQTINAPSPEENAAGGMVRVLIAAAPREGIDARMAVLLGSNVDVSSVVPNGIALANVLSALGLSTQGIGVAIDVSQSETTFVAVPEDGQAYAPIVRYITDGLNLFNTKDGADESAVPTFDSGNRHRRAQWSREVGLSVQFAADKLGVEPPEIRVVGPGAASRDLLQWLEQDIQIPVRSWNPLTELARADDGPDDVFVEQYGAHLAATLGLVLTEEG